MNRKRWAPVAAVGAVLAVLLGVSMLSNNRSAAGPPVLRLSATEGSFAAAAVGARGSYRLIGTLPDGPSEARIRDLPATAVPFARVRALAVALGETAAPTRVAGAWKAGHLVVTDEPGNPWNWGATCAPDTPVSSDGGVAKDLPALNCPDGTASSGTASSGTASSGTAPSGSTSSGTAPSDIASPGTASPGTAPSDIASPGTVQVCPTGATPCPSAGIGGGSNGSSVGGGVSCTRDGPCAKPSVGGCPSPPPGAELVACDPKVIPQPLPKPPEQVLVSKSQALTATASIRQALGLGDAPARVEGLSLVVEPLAGALPTTGMATRFQLSSPVRVISATGSLSIGQEGALYPLRPARKAFDAIPVLALGAPCDPAGCPEGPAVTGARLGLSRVALDHGAAALVPAWLFTVQSSPVPLVALAVADRFLGGPDPAGTTPGGVPGTSGPGIIAPNPNGSVGPPPPATSKPIGATGREGFAFDAAYADADPMVLVVRYGDSGSCLSQAVRHDVVEQPDRVVVTLTRTPMPSDQPCRMDYQAKLVRITLSAPLGSREVVDGSRKVPVPISTGLPPLG